MLTRPVCSTSWATDQGVFVEVIQPRSRSGADRVVPVPQIMVFLPGVMGRRGSAVAVHRQGLHYGGGSRGLWRF